MQSSNNIDVFSTPLSAELANNKRLTTRYVRDDIAASIKVAGRFYFDKKEIPAELLDIASNGALVATAKKLELNRKIILKLRFETGKTFEIPSQCVNMQGKAGGHHYGIKFDQYNDELGDYLLETQTKLIFK